MITYLVKSVGKSDGWQQADLVEALSAYSARWQAQTIRPDRTIVSVEVYNTP